MRNSNKFTVGLIFLILITCSKTLSVKKEKIPEKIDDINYLLQLIYNYNSRSPQSYNARFTIEGKSSKQKFKVDGSSQFTKNPKRMRIIFHDAIFKTPITEVIQDEDTVKIFFPFENILYIDNIKNIDLSFYTKIILDFNFIYDLSIFRIPVIENFTVKKALEDKDESIKSEELIILENEDYYETISFTQNIPSKILWINKNTKEKFEVYLKDHIIINDALTYKTIKIKLINYDLIIDFQFNSIKINAPIDPDKIIDLKLSNDVKIINRN